MRDIIVLEKIYKKYAKKEILKDINLSIQEGDFIALVGESGAGKSTLLNIMGLLDEPTSGRITIKGITYNNSRDKKAAEVRRNTISYLFQNFALIEEETVNKNLKLALHYQKKLKIDKQKEIDNVLEKFGILELKNNKVFQLSGGEQQRVALARVILQDNDIVLADEPTGSLDEKNRQIVIDNLAILNKSGKTVVVVTHDKYVAESCNKIINLT